MPLVRYGILGLLIICGTALADVEILYFRAYAQINRARLEWNSGNETNFDQYIIERSSDAVNYMPVGTVESTGSFSEYSFNDSSPLDADMDRVFYYRLKMMDESGAYRYSDVVSVSLTFSPVQQTWGSIKAMFR
jgi:hypothetical protein